MNYHYKLPVTFEERKKIKSTPLQQQIHNSNAEDFGPQCVDATLHNHPLLLMQLYSAF